MRRTLLIALVVLLGVTALASQPWFEVGLSSGNSLTVGGFEAYPNFGATLLVDALAIVLVIYLQRRWGVIFLLAGALALALSLLAQLPALVDGNLSMLAPIVEKATGISSWLAQLEQVVLSRQTTFFGFGSLVLSVVLLVVHILAIIDAFKKTATVVKRTRDRVQSRSKRAGKDEPQQPTVQDLWHETNPENL
mgnify:FL=1